MTALALDLHLVVDTPVLDQLPSAARGHLVEAVTATVDQMRTALDLRGAPRVVVTAGSVVDPVDGSPFALTVAGRGCPSRAGVLAAALAFVLPPSTGHPPPGDVRARLADGADGRLPQLAARWCGGVLDAAPGLLLGDEEARARAGELGLEPTDVEPLQALLAHRVSLARAADGPSSSGGGQEARQDWFEELLSQAVTEVRLRFHPRLLRRLTLSGDQTERSVLRDLRQEVFDGLGLLLPPFRFVVDATLPEECFAFDIADLTTPPVRALPERWALETTEYAEDEVPSRQSSDPVAARPHEVSPLTDSDVGGLWHVAGALRAAVRDTAACFVTVPSTEAALDLTAAIHPTLVAAVRTGYGTPVLAALLRDLVRDGVSLRHLPPLLERLDEVSLGLATAETDVGSLLRGAAAWSTSDALRRGDASLLVLSEQDESDVAAAGRGWARWTPPDDPTAALLRLAYRRAWDDDTRALPPVVLAHQAPATVAQALRPAFPVASVLGPADVVPAELSEQAQPLRLR